MVHDLGKIGIKDDILDKKGAFTEKEMSHIRRHSLIGCKIIHKVRLFRLEEPIVRHHHERFDGKGYPDGLKGEKIPLESRIIAVADAYDAMTSKRSYRRSLTREAAFQEIRRCAGTQFDPAVCEGFFSAVSNGTNGKECRNRCKK